MLHTCMSEQRPCARQARSSVGLIGDRPGSHTGVTAPNKYFNSNRQSHIQRVALQDSIVAPFNSSKEGFLISTDSQS